MRTQQIVRNSRTGWAVRQIIEEAEAAGAELGPDTLRLGFYSYCEISPHTNAGLRKPHNQTMTVTTFAEVA
jgi:hypothetical protein